MPSTNPTLPFLTTTNNNTRRKDKIYDATVVANYGDPGLQEDYFADILSKYVICMLESSNRVLTNDKWKDMLVLVKRPPALTITYQSNQFVNNPNAQSRVDYFGNVNTGPASSYTVSTISPINNPYQLGETIKVKLIEDKNDFCTYNQNSLFQSACSGNIFDGNNYYGNWHTQGINNAYIQSENVPPALNLKTIIPITTYPTNNAIANANPNLYNMMLNKVQYEAFVLNQYPQFANQMIALFQGNSNYAYYYVGNGGYLFYQNFFTYLNTCQYEDINVSQKARVPNVNCLPLVVAAPQTFTVPQVRSPSTVNYMPTYIQQN